MIATQRETKSYPANSIFVLTTFWIAILFQETSLKYIWGLELVSRAINIISLAVVATVAVYAVRFKEYPRIVWYLYILPGSLVAAGMALNFSRATLVDLSMVSHFGLILPWVTYLIVPILTSIRSINVDSLWVAFYRFMVISVLLGLTDYAAVFLGGTALHSVETPNGPFLAGRFSLLFGLADGVPHDRFYGVFNEPGSLAMMILPALAYSVWHKRPFGCAVLLIGFFFTRSLGGYLALFVLVMITAFLKARRYGVILAVISVPIMISVATLLQLGEKWGNQYEDRGDSRTVREQNVIKVVTRLPHTIVYKPLGIRLVGPGSDEDAPYNFGTNFTIGNALQFGGVAALIGYLVTLMVSLALAAKALTVRALTPLQKAAFSSLASMSLFIVQRTTIWDSSLFAFLFAPLILSFLSGKDGKSNLSVKSPEAIGL